MSANNLNPLRKLPVNGQYGRPYDYVAKFPALVSGGSNTLPVEIDANYVFKWQKLSFDRWTNGAQLLTDEVLIQITDSRSSRNFFDSMTPLSVFCGSGDETQEFILPVPHLFDPSCVILVTIQNTNTVGAATSSFDIVFGGIKVPVQSQGFG
jgi:hypothetical protein